MRQRKFLGMLGAATMGPLVAHAQQTELRRIPGRLTSGGSIRAHVFLGSFQHFFGRLFDGELIRSSLDLRMDELRE